MYHRTSVSQSTHIPRVPQCLSPRWNWDPHTPSPASECALPPPPEPKGGGEEVHTHSSACEGVGKSQFGRLERKLALCLLWGQCPNVVLGNFLFNTCDDICALRMWLHFILLRGIPVGIKRRIVDICKLISFYLCKFVVSVLFFANSHSKSAITHNNFVQKNHGNKKRRILCRLKIC